MKLLQRGTALVLLLATALLALPALADDTITITSRGTTNVRSGPGTTYSIIGQLFEGDTATADGRSGTDNAWLRIDFDGDEGWVAASVVRLDGDPTTLEVVEASDDAEEYIGETGVVVTFEDEVNVRIGPSADYRVLATGAEDDEYDVTGRTAFDDTVVCRGGTLIDTARGEAPENVWLRINFQGVNAWVNYTAVSVSGDLCDVEEAEVDDFDALLEEAEEETGIAIDSVLVITTDSVRLRETNYASSDVLAVIPYDTSLVAEARDDDGERIRVTYQGETGWISVSYVNFTRGSLDDLDVDAE